MTRHAALVLLPLLLCTTPALAAEIACDGPLGPDGTLAGLEAAYGKDNVVTGEVPGAEGESYIATTVYPNDPQRSFVVYWNDPDTQTGLSGFSVPAADTAPGGLRIGMPLRDVEALNGEPFTLLGFYWDYGGAARFETGKLATLPGGCMLSVSFTPTIDPPDGPISDAVSGDKELRSDLKELDAVKPVISDITLGYPDPEFDGDGGSEEQGDIPAD